MVSRDLSPADIPPDEAKVVKSCLRSEPCRGRGILQGPDDPTGLPASEVHVEESIQSSSESSPDRKHTTVKTIQYQANSDDDEERDDLSPSGRQRYHLRREAGDATAEGGDDQDNISLDSKATRLSVPTLSTAESGGAFGGRRGRQTIEGGASGGGAEGGADERTDRGGCVKDSMQSAVGGGRREAKVVRDDRTDGNIHDAVLIGQWKPHTEAVVSIQVYNSQTHD